MPGVQATAVVHTFVRVICHAFQSLEADGHARKQVPVVLGHELVRRVDHQIAPAVAARLGILFLKPRMFTRFVCFSDQSAHTASTAAFSACIVYNVDM